METGHHHEPTKGWRAAGVTDEEWEGLHRLLELVRQEHLRTELSPERRDQIRERVLERIEKVQARRRRWRLFFSAAGVALAAGIALTVALRARAD
jgi:siroheme synthase (precorrin-2 oxidase/ferrochelatase)